jgi:hypothetical protein
MPRLECKVYFGRAHGGGGRGGENALHFLRRRATTCHGNERANLNINPAATNNSTPNSILWRPPDDTEPYCSYLLLLLRDHPPAIRPRRSSFAA